MPVNRPIGADSHLYLIDASGYIFRAFHALPPLSRKSDGLPVGAVAGYCNMLWKLLEDLRNSEQPTHFACIFDKSGVTFRNELFAQYKAHRPPPPPDLVPQFPLVRAATEAFGAPAIELEGYEADDLIATYARQAEAAGARVTIVSSDKDLMQLVSDRIRLLDTMKDRAIGREQVIEKFGVPPEKVTDVQALCGDTADNIPGAPGIGVKTAAELITTFGDVETLLQRLGEIRQPKRRETLIASADSIRLSHRLVQLCTTVPAPTPLEALGVCDPDPARLIGFLESMEFRTLTRRVAERLASPTGQAAPAARAPVAPAPGSGPAAYPAPFDLDAYETVDTVEALARWVEEARRLGRVAIDTETDSLDAMGAALVGVSMAIAPGRACYIPIGHGAKNDLLAGDTPRQIARADLVRLLGPLLSDPSVLKIGQNIKYDLAVLARHDMPVLPIDDTMLISFVLEAGAHGHGMDELSERHLAHKPIAFKDIAGSGKTQITFDQAPIPEATRYAAEDADVTLRLWEALRPRLSREGLLTLYETQDRRLVSVVCDMERAGILVDRDILGRLSQEFAARMAQLEQQAHAAVGREFNLASPKQIGDILFGELSLPGGKKTKTGAWATAADTLEELAAEGHALPQIILDWRALAKLRSTYTEALREAINAATGRVHTSFSLVGAQTGRLSSSDPNLQNIPIRSDEGRKIRTAFIAPQGCRLISADYSQIELRLLAHVADIPSLAQAFREGVDIHAMTASEIFGVPIEGMDPMIRRQAKAINFGIIYGISAFGLARQLGIGRDQAAAYIRSYFEKFPGIRDYMETAKAFAREHGYVETIFGRKCWLPQIASANAPERAFAERQAINAPLQGSAADIMKRAMINVASALGAEGLRTRLLLQVHDELVLEAPEEEIAEVLPLVRDIMVRAALPAIEMKVPLLVEAKAGHSWAEAH
jgi:DNA polymerase-1